MRTTPTTVLCVLALLAGCASSRSEPELPSAVDGGDDLSGDDGDPDAELVAPPGDRGDASADASEQPSHDATAGDGDGDGDAASGPLAPGLELVSPRNLLEIYPGSTVQLRLRCEPGPGSAEADLTYGFIVESPEHEISGSEAAVILDQVGDHEVRAVCTDSRTGLSAQTGAIVRVLDPGYVVYGPSASPIADLAQRAWLLPLPTVPSVSLRQAHYALGGEAMVVVSSTAGVDAVRAYYRSPEAHSIELGSGAGAYQLSPDGRYVVPIDTADLELLDLQNAGDSNVVFAGSGTERAGAPFFSADGSRLAFSVESSTDAYADAYVLQTSAPSALAPLVWPDTTHIRATHVSEHAVFAELRYQSLEVELRAFDLQGQSRAALTARSTPASFSAAYCGNNILVSDAGGGTTLWQDAPQGLRSAPLEGALPMRNIRDAAHFSADCSLVVYASSQHVSVLRLPDVSGALGQLEAIVIADEPAQGYRTAVLSAHGRYLAVSEWHDQQLALRIYDLESTPELVASLENVWEPSFAPDESSLAYHAMAAGEVNAAPLGSVELRVRTLGEGSEPEERVVYGPYRVPLPILWSPLGQNVALNSAAARNADGTVSTASGIVELDLSGASEPRVLVEASRGSATMIASAQRVPGRRAVLFATTGELEAEARIYAHALEEGAEPIEQVTGLIPAWTVSPPVLSRTGAAFAVHQRSAAADYFAAVGLRTHDGDPHSVSSMPSEGGYIGGFGDTDHSLVIEGGGVLKYCDLEQTSTVDLAPGLVESAVSGRAQLVDRVGKLFFMAGDGPAGTHPLYVWPVGASEAVEIAPEVREFHVAPSGDWLVLRVRDGSIWLSDASRNWASPQRIESAALSGGAPLVEFYENGFAEGAALRLSAATVLVRRDSTAPEHELSAPVAFTRSQDRAFFMHPDGTPGTWAIAGLDLTIRDPELVVHRQGIECQAIDAYTEEVWANNLVSAHGRYFTAMCVSAAGRLQQIFDLETGQMRSEPSVRSPELSFDRTGRFLGHPAFTESGQPLGLHLLDLDDFDAPAIELPAEGFYEAPLWVD